MAVKMCLKCFKPHSLDLFKVDSKGYILNECDQCKSDYHKTYQKEYREKNKDLLNAKRRSKRGSNVRNYEKRVVIKTVSTKCSVRNCHEHKVDEDYCKSHRFDILNNII